MVADVGTPLTYIVFCNYFRRMCSHYTAMYDGMLGEPIPLVAHDITEYIHKC